MSLLKQIMEPCVILNRVRTDDPVGGYKEDWVEGATFQAAIGKLSSPELVIAEKQGLSETFTVVVNKGFSLDYHDVFKRVSDGSTFRVTSRTQDSESHPASTVRIAKVTAERWTPT